MNIFLLSFALCIYLGQRLYLEGNNANMFPYKEKKHTSINYNSVQMYGLS